MFAEQSPGGRVIAQPFDIGGDRVDAGLLHFPDQASCMNRQKSVEFLAGNFATLKLAEKQRWRGDREEVHGLKSIAQVRGWMQAGARVMPLDRLLWGCSVGEQRRTPMGGW